jgi:hypothetical protein
MGAVMSRKNPFVRPLSIEEIEAAARGFKEDLQREANRMIRRHNNTGALVALEGIEYINNFVSTLAPRAGSRLGFPARSRPIHLFKKRGGVS